MSILLNALTTLIIQVWPMMWNEDWSSTIQELTLNRIPIQEDPFKSSIANIFSMYMMPLRGKNNWKVGAEKRKRPCLMITGMKYENLLLAKMTPRIKTGIGRSALPCFDFAQHDRGRLYAYSYRDEYFFCHPERSRRINRWRICSAWQEMAIRYLIRRRILFLSSWAKSKDRQKKSNKLNS